jgi:aldehyde dehydrogenase (NAD+)
VPKRLAIAQFPAERYPFFPNGTEFHQEGAKRENALRHRRERRHLRPRHGQSAAVTTESRLMTLSFDPDTFALAACHFIGGAAVTETPGMALRRPSDGAALADAPVAGVEIVDRAVETAQRALRSSGWGTSPPRERTRALHRWADLLEADAATLARLEAICSTRPVGQLPAGDIAVTAEQIRFFAEMADKEGGDLVPTAADALGMTVTEPYGVVAAITPWNFPLSMAGWKLGPALAAGNAVVLKPSELTPFSSLRAAELAVHAGIPAGIVNVVLGDGPTTGTALTGHPGVAKVSFTGSTGAGQAIMANIARTGVKPMTLELGGKSPQVVFADADLTLAADCIARSIVFNAGQACVAGSRVIVAASVADALAEALTARMAAVRPGPTWDAASEYSPIISERQIARVAGLVDAAVTEGAEVLHGGGRMDAPGYFYAPTLLAGVSPDSVAVREEIFGPVLTLQTFETEEEALALADHPTYGLCAGVYTRDLSRALRAMKRIEAGTVWVNRYGRSRDHILPTGGYKASGLGKDLGREAYHANRRSKSVLIGI